MKDLRVGDVVLCRVRALPNFVINSNVPGQIIEVIDDLREPQKKVQELQKKAQIGNIFATDIEKSWNHVTDWSGYRIDVSIRTQRRFYKTHELTYVGYLTPTILCGDVLKLLIRSAPLTNHNEPEFNVDDKVMTIGGIMVTILGLEQDTRVAEYGMITGWNYEVQDAHGTTYIIPEHLILCNMSVPDTY